MKDKIHPKYFDVEVRCACGCVIKTRSTRQNFEVNVCSACHPFFTGAEDRFLDTAGRVERFQRRFEWSGDKAKKEAGRPRSKASKGVKLLANVESRARGAKAAKPAAADAGAGEAKAETKAKAEPKLENKGDKK
jgi:large subunit ribosomal protein L31